MVDIDKEQEGDKFYKAAENFLNEERYEEAMKAYGKAIDAGCSYMAEALNMRGTFTYLTGDSNGALEDFKKALEIKPDYVQIYVKRATIYMEQGSIEIFCFLMKHELIRDFIDNADLAYREFEEAIKIDPNDPDIYYHRFFSSLKLFYLYYVYIYVYIYV
jgi:import receptor subunit TOM70